MGDGTLHEKGDSVEMATVRWRLRMGIGGKRDARPEEQGMYERKVQEETAAQEDGLTDFRMFCTNRRSVREKFMRSRRLDSLLLRWGTIETEVKERSGVMDSGC